jgi:DNA adenine methylase
MGGKHRLAKHLAPIVNEARGDSVLWEPFCGGLNVTAALGGRIIATDLHPALISLYKAIQRDGWKLDYYALAENEITREQHAAAKRLPDSDPLKAFVGFGCSFGGDYFHGHAGGLNGGKHTCTQLAARGLTRKFAKLDQVEFHCEPFGQREFTGVIYCDPPYRDTVQYNIKFDYDQFVTDVERYASNGCTLFVSERSFPIGEAVWEKPYTNQIGSGTGNTVKSIERLYRIG